MFKPLLKTVLLILVLFFGTQLRADERLFGHSYLAEVLPKGDLEF